MLFARPTGWCRTCWPPSGISRCRDNYVGSTTTDLLLLDDLGYLSQGAEESEVLFTLIAERYERRSLGTTFNLVFSQWDPIFANPRFMSSATVTTPLSNGVGNRTGMLVDGRSFMSGYEVVGEWLDSVIKFSPSFLRRPRQRAEMLHGKLQSRDPQVIPPRGWLRIPFVSTVYASVPPLAPVRAPSTCVRQGGLPRASK